MAVGFIVGVPNDSDDALSAADARRLSELVPPYVTRVLVTHHHDPGTVDALADEIGVDEVQTPACVLCWQGATTRRCTRPRSTGVVYIDGDTAEDRAMEIAPLYDAVHLDSQVSRRRGGTGVTHDWSISKRIAERIARPVILSGGLTPGNIAAAVDRIRPHAVDVNSGVEDAGGFKALDLLLDFVAACRQRRA